MTIIKYSTANLELLEDKPEWLEDDKKTESVSKEDSSLKEKQDKEVK